MGRTLRDQPWIPPRRGPWRAFGGRSGHRRQVRLVGPLPGGRGRRWARGGRRRPWRGREAHGAQELKQRRSALRRGGGLCGGGRLRCRREDDDVIGPVGRVDHRQRFVRRERPVRVEEVEEERGPAVDARRRSTLRHDAAGPARQSDNLAVDVQVERVPPQQRLAHHHDARHRRALGRGLRVENGNGGVDPVGGRLERDRPSIVAPEHHRRGCGGRDRPSVPNLLHRSPPLTGQCSCPAGAGRGRRRAAPRRRAGNPE